MSREERQPRPTKPRQTTYFDVHTHEPQMKPSEYIESLSILDRGFWPRASKKTAYSVPALDELPDVLKPQKHGPLPPLLHYGFRVVHDELVELANKKGLYERPPLRAEIPSEQVNPEEEKHAEKESDEGSSDGLDEESDYGSIEVTKKVANMRLASLPNWIDPLDLLLDDAALHVGGDLEYRCIYCKEVEFMFIAVCNSWQMTPDVGKVADKLREYLGASEPAKWYMDFEEYRWAKF